jgi:hypothetical protein
MQAGDSYRSLAIPKHHRIYSMLYYQEMLASFKIGAVTKVNPCPHTIPIEHGGETIYI